MRLGFGSFQEYLNFVDADGQVQAMVQSHRTASATANAPIGAPADAPATVPASTLAEPYTDGEQMEFQHSMSGLFYEGLGAEPYVDLDELEGLGDVGLGDVDLGQLEWPPLLDAFYEGFENSGAMWSEPRYAGPMEQPPQSRLQTLSPTPEPSTRADAPATPPATPPATVSTGAASASADAEAGPSDTESER